MLNTTQIRALRSGNAIVIGLNVLSNKYPLRDSNNVAARVDYSFNGEFVGMSFDDDCGQRREIRARLNDTAFWSKASTPASTTAAAVARRQVDPAALSQGDSVIFKLYNTAGNHPMNDPDNVSGTVLPAKTAAFVRIRYTDGCGAQHTIKVSKRTDREFWSTCFYDDGDASMPVHTDAPVVQSTDLVQVRNHIEVTRTAVAAITSQAKASVDLLEDLKAHVEDRLATISDTLVALDEQLDTVRDELEQAVAKLEH